MAPRYSKTLQNVTITFILCGAIVGIAGMMIIREDIKSRVDAYRYCLDLKYSPNICYATVFRAPKLWEKR